MNTTTVGVLARIEMDRRDEISKQLSDIKRVETFDAGSREQIGVLVEADSVDEAHQTITQKIAKTDGVLCAWPVYVNFDDEAGDGDEDLAKLQEAMNRDESLNTDGSPNAESMIARST